ncbi:MAG TPA: adventurous gliding motility lipoprotein CglB [Myxococcaceae bacterium]|jgi:hypothetical protein
MRAKLILLSAFVVGIVGGSLASGCQTYDFEPVDPLALAQTTKGDVIRARALKPNMMVLLDTSGSMTLPADGTLAACQVSNPTNPARPLCGDQGNPPCNVNTCPTRWSELRSAMGAFLGNSGTVARLGLTTYPAAAAGQCGASSSVRIPIPKLEEVRDDEVSKLQDKANAISDVILNQIALDSSSATPDRPSPIGGTPTSQSLRFVGEQPELQAQDREDFVLLLTDGLPNCNAGNPNGGNATTCRCTQSPCPTTYPALLCLDKDASVAAVTDLRTQKQIRTIVIGFGADFTSGRPETQAGAETLNEMAVAGEFARNLDCTTDAQCGANDTCNPTTRKCNRRFYLASNQAELANALNEIISRVDPSKVCQLALEQSQRPSDENLIVVYLGSPDDATLPSLPRVSSTGETNWELNETGILFLGSACQRIQNSDDDNPVKIEVRAVQRK